MTVPVAAPVPDSRPWWRRVRAGTVVGSAIAGGLFGYMSNVWIMAVRSDGFNVKGGSAAAAPGNLGQGSLFWLLGPTVVFSIVGYWKAVGSKRFFFEMRRLPGLLLTLGRSSGGSFQVQFLLGALVGVVASVWIGPALGAVCSIGFVAMLPTPASSLLSSLGYKATHLLASKLARPSPAVSPEGAGLMSSVVVLFGSAAALLVGFFLNSTSVKWAIAAALLVLLVLRSSRLRAARLPLVLVFVGLVGIGLLVSTGSAAADDGGWSECSGQSWWSCPGSDAVREWAALGGFLGALGGTAGAILGGMIGSWPAGSIFDDPEFLSPGDPGNDLDPSDADGWIRESLDEAAFTEWAATHEPSSPLAPEDFDDYMIWRHDQGLNDPPLPEDTVTTVEGVAEPVDKFEGSEGWSGAPAQDEFGDFYTPEVEEEIFGDADRGEISDETDAGEDEPLLGASPLTGGYGAPPEDGMDAPSSQEAALGAVGAAHAVLGEAPPTTDNAPPAADAEEVTWNAGAAAGMGYAAAGVGPEPAAGANADEAGRGSEVIAVPEASVPDTSVPDSTEPDDTKPDDTKPEDTEAKPLPLGPVPLDTVRAILGSSPIGAAAVEYAARHKPPITIELIEDGESHWDAANNRIVIDATDSDDFARSFVHEVNHAQGSDAMLSVWQNGTKDEYVEFMIDQEAEGMVKAIKAHQELEAAGKHPKGTPTLGPEYSSAYDQAVEEYRQEHPNASAPELAEVGERAGTARVRFSLETGSDGLCPDDGGLGTYRSYYEKGWDEQHLSSSGGGP